jgi:uncharacterized protein involved in response to NO
MWTLLRREPYRLFFPLGVGFGILGAGHWLAYAAGWSEGYSGFFHAAIQTGAFLPSFIVGFLLTALPRFTSTPAATSAEVLLFLSLLMAQPLCAARGAWVAAECCAIAWLLALAVFAGRRLAWRRAAVTPPIEFVWIPFALLFGLLGHALLIGGQLQWLPVGVLALARPLAQQGFLLAIVVGVSGFMAPRLLGRGFVAVAVTGIDPVKAHRLRQRRVQAHAAGALLLLLSFLLEGGGWLQAGYALRALVVTMVLAWTTQFHRPATVPDMYARLLRVSLWMLPLGYAGAAWLPGVRVAMLHLAFLGGYSLMIFAVGTMVVFSHAGEALTLRGRSMPLRVVGGLVAAAAALRASADWLPQAFFPIVAIAAAAWMAAGVLWLLWLRPYWLRTASAKTLEQHHAQAKARVLRTAALLLVGWAFSAPAGWSDEAAAKAPSAFDAALDQLGHPMALGSRATLKVGGEFRYRLEWRDNLNLNDAAYEDDAVHLLRTRLQAALQVEPGLKVFVQGQDSESFAASAVNRTSAAVNQLDLHQLYAELASPWKAAPLRLTLGRQELAYGDQRFVGAGNFTNTGRVFDAVKLRFLHAKDWTTDLWFAQVVPVNRVRPDAADHGENFYGWYTSMARLPRHTIDAFLLIRHDRDNELVGERSGQRGQLKEYTLGNRVKGAWHALDYGLEGAWQTGSRAHNVIRAWAWHQELGYTWGTCPWKPRLGMEYNHGSGDDDTSDGRFGTFTAPYPTNHTPYGEIDFTSLRNLDHLELNASATPHQRVKLTGKYHWFFLDSNKSAWFNSSQGVFRAAAANASRTLGQETDLMATWALSPHLQLAAAYAYFHAGAFARDSGADENAHYAYVQSMLSF